MIARRNLRLCALTLFLFLVGCTDKGDAPVGSLHPDGVAATYSYRAYNSKGELAVSGTMTFEEVDTISVSGIWAFAAVLTSEAVGPQVGTGKLAGSLQKSSISINLNPGWADNNVFLQGTVFSDSITGRWMWSTFVGPTAEGKFRAIKVVSTFRSGY